MNEFDANELKQILTALPARNQQPKVDIEEAIAIARLRSKLETMHTELTTTTESGF